MIWRNPFFIIGFLYLSVLFGASLIHQIFFDSYISQTSFSYNSNGDLIAPPFPPLEVSILGTDRFGNHLIQILLMGAKYSLGGVLGITIVTMFLALIFGIFLGLVSKKKVRRFLKSSLFAFYFIPGSLLSYLLLYPILWEPIEGFHYNLPMRILIEVVVIGIILVPPTSIFISENIAEAMERNYVQSSIVLGGSRYHILIIHIIPELKFTLLHTALRTSLQGLLIIGHLGVFKLFFGGTDVSYDPFAPSPPVSITNEWFSYIGSNYEAIFTSAHWLLWIPLLAIVFTVLSLQFIMLGIEKVWLKNT
ncbi:ABC transporter permease subunit [Terribacillus sp. AE2B 122]|uniref:ABC transporter permease subunit n=1 Tax=Terribacillus sp. AE2B 122 TaxID=1331902 RepID=UPI001583B6E8|nr:ABC transporter permease subunit [Terribacillus sp. AE2B 122]